MRKRKEIEKGGLAERGKDFEARALLCFVPVAQSKTDRPGSFIITLEIVSCSLYNRSVIQV